LDEIGTEAKMDEIGGAKVKMCTPVHGLSVYYTDFLAFLRSNRQKFRVPEYTFSLLPLNLVQFGFCINIIQFRFSSLNKLRVQ